MNDATQLANPRPRRIRAGAALLLGHFALVGCLRGDPDEPLEAQDIPRLQGIQILFSERFARQVGLKTAPVIIASVIPSLAVVGTVTFDPEHVAHVGTRLRGIVREVRHVEGDTVHKNEVLATIDSPELGEAQATVTSLRAELEAARHNANRENGLIAVRLTTLKESEGAWTLFERYRALLSAAEHKIVALAGTRRSEKQPIGIHTITSPLEGTVFERRISKGNFIDGDYTAFVVGTLDRVWVELAVFEQALRTIQVGDEVELRPLGFRGQPLRGLVARDGNFVQAATRSASVRVQVDNQARLLRPGQAVDAVVKTSAAAEPLGPVVPASSIIYTDGSAAVFVRDTPGSVRLTRVELGASDGANTAIKGGLDVGTQVVVEGTFELKSELFR